MIRFHIRFCINWTHGYDTGGPSKQALLVGISTKWAKNKRQKYVIIPKPGHVFHPPRSSLQLSLRQFGAEVFWIRGGGVRSTHPLPPQVTKLDSKKSLIWCHLGGIINHSWPSSTIFDCFESFWGDCRPLWAIFSVSVIIYHFLQPKRPKSGRWWPKMVPWGGILLSKKYHSFGVKFRPWNVLYRQKNRCDCCLRNMQFGVFPSILNPNMVERI